MPDLDKCGLCIIVASCRWDKTLIWRWYLDKGY